MENGADTLGGRGGRRRLSREGTGGEAGSKIKNLKNSQKYFN